MMSNNKKQLEELEAELRKKETEKRNSEKELKQYQQAFQQSEQLVNKLKQTKSTLRSVVRSIPAYLLGRRNLKQLYSTTYKKKDAANQLKKYKVYLYDLGLEARALKDLKEIYQTTENHYLKKAIAWELGLWYANKLTKHDARIAIEYLEVFLSNEKDENRLREVSLLLAESYELLDENELGKNLINTRLQNGAPHADLYLAAANLESSVEARVEMINKALKLYDIKEISLASKENLDAYYRLISNVKSDNMIESGPKVSVVIPAYNSEQGIRIAIESMLEQTWQNLEIIVVDDCSTDHTAEVIKEYGRKTSRVKQLSTSENSGPYVARNIGLEHAEGEYVTINDADDWSHPEKIEKQVKHLIKNKHIIANTSEHARLTEDLRPYRRGMPGKYIFSNMSSMMFKKDIVLEEIGYWDAVRFAGDSEFKNRIINVFGKETVVDLPTGPLSFPMHSTGSLTASSANGYYGFLMGARKEYAASYRYYHNKTNTLYTPKDQNVIFYPVPEPMWPLREEKVKGYRKFDIVLISDFRSEIATDIIEQLKAMKQLGYRVGLVQMSEFNLKLGKQINQEIRALIDGEYIQMLVYGENISCDILLINNPVVFSEKQRYVPNLVPKVVRVIIGEPPIGKNGKKQYDLRHCARNIDEFVQIKQKWYPINDKVRKDLLENHLKELRSIPLSVDNWLNEEWNHDLFKTLLENWLVDENPFELNKGGGR